MRDVALPPVQAIVPLEVAEEVGGFSSLTPSGTSVLLEGQLTQTPEGTKQARLRTYCLQKPA